MMTTYFEEFSEKLQALDVASGDILYVSSDMTRLTAGAIRTLKLRGKSGIDDYLNGLVETLQTLVGEKGTLLFPIFSWDFCRGKTFDIRSSLGDTGSLPNWILTHRTDFLRTRHPLYSFLVWGKDAELLRHMDNKDAWGTDSPFGYCHRNQAKLLLLDVTPGQGNTFHHYIEEMARVPYRYPKDFVSGYIDEFGHEERRRYQMYVRDLSIESEELTADDFYDKNGLQKKTEFSGVTIRLIDLAATYQPLVNDLLTNGGANLYRFHDYEIDWSLGQTHEDDLIQ